MAPLYLGAGAFGNLLSVAHSWAVGAEHQTVGASGAISGLIAAAFVLGWRTQGWRGPLTQAMGRWLLFVLVFGMMSRNIDNSAHLGGALAGGTIAAMWRRGRQYSRRATSIVLGACGAVVVACAAIVAAHDRFDRFANVRLADRADPKLEALARGRCWDAINGLQGYERLRAPLGAESSLTSQGEETCARVAWSEPLLVQSP